MNKIKTALKQHKDGQAAIARRLGISPQFIGQIASGRRPAPARLCPGLEELIGVRCEDLRSDLTWTRGHDGKVTGYHVAIDASLGERDA